MKSGRKIFWRLLALIAPLWPAMLLTAALGLVTVAANVGLMAAAAYLIAAAALHPPLAALSPAIVGVRFFGLLRAVARYLERYVAHDTTFLLLSRLRVRVYEAVEPLAPAGLPGLRSGELFSRIVGDVETLKFFYLQVLFPPAVALLALCGMTAVLAVFDRAFAGLLAAAFFATGVLLPLLAHHAGRGASRELPRARAHLAAVLADSIGGLRDLAAFDQAERQIERVAAANAAYIRWQGRAASLGGLVGASSNLFMNLAVAGAIIIGIPLLGSGQLNGVYLAALALGIQSSFEAVLPAASLYRYWEESREAASRLPGIAGTPPAISRPSSSEGLETVNILRLSGLPSSYDLAAEDLKFRYPDRPDWALDGLSFSLPAGGRMAIVGPSGAGKSTLAALLLGFWDYDSGHIWLAGKELRDYPPPLLRQIIGVVRQDDYIFSATLGDNIRLARPEATDAAVLAAAQQAGLGNVISSLPLGLDTLVGENGYGLSGGERRRVSIARVLLKDPPLIVLDEPAAGLDPVTERGVMAAIAGNMAGRTMILITHRLTGLETMDEILVLKDGRVAERGRQDELLARRGLFYTLQRLQNDVISDIMIMDNA